MWSTFQRRKRWLKLGFWEPGLWGVCMLRSIALTTEDADEMIDTAEKESAETGKVIKIERAG